MYNTLEMDKYSLKWGTERIKQIFGNDSVIPLWVADMDFPCPPELVRTMKERAENGIYGYSAADSKSLEPFMSWMKKKHSLEIDKSWIRITPGVVPALHTAVRAFSSPGNSVIVQTPVYYPFFSAIENNDRQIIRNPLKLDNGRYEMDFDNLEKNIHGHTKLLILCSPHNPGGRVWKMDELIKLVEICSKFNIKILSDEIHCDLVYNGHTHIPIINAVPEIAEITALFYGPGKTFNCAGLQIGTAVIPGKKMRQLFDAAMRETGYMMSNSFSVSGFEAAYHHGEDWLKKTMSVLEKQKNTAIDFFRKKFPEIGVIVPEATYLLWLDCRKLKVSSEEIKNLLAAENGVGVSSGAVFGGEGFIRINFACSEELLSEALSRIEKALRKIL